MLEGVGDGKDLPKAGKADDWMDKEPTICVSSRTFTKESLDEKQVVSYTSSSSYLLADDHSQNSRDIDRWMNNSGVPSPAMLTSSGVTSPTTLTTTTDNGIQGSRIPVVQRSVLARSSSLENSGLWYMLAVVMPLFSVNTCPHWRCTPSLVLHTAELFMTHFSRACGNVRGHLRQLAQDQVARELFATAMDIVLVIYAIGFLILSMYQASVFG